MTKRTNVVDLADFDVSLYLNSEVEIAAYLTDIFAANDTALLVSALCDIALVRGLSEIAKSADISPEALRKELGKGGGPSFDTIYRVCTALGLRLVATSQ